MVDVAATSSRGRRGAQPERQLHDGHCTTGHAVSLLDDGEAVPLAHLAESGPLAPGQLELPLERIQYSGLVGLLAGCPPEEQVPEAESRGLVVGDVSHVGHGVRFVALKFGFRAPAMA